MKGLTLNTICQAITNQSVIGFEDNEEVTTETAVETITWLLSDVLPTITNKTARQLQLSRLSISDAITYLFNHFGVEAAVEEAVEEVQEEEEVKEMEIYTVTSVNKLSRCYCYQLEDANGKVVYSTNCRKAAVDPTLVGKVVTGILNEEGEVEAKTIQVVD